MIYQIIGDNGQPLDAHAEVDATGITLESRGGSAALGNVKNADYGPALRLLLRRIAVAQLPLDRAWVDSMDVRRLPIEQRVILHNSELKGDGSSAFTLMSSRMKAVGQKEGRRGGNSTKRIRIQFAAELDVANLTATLRVIETDRELARLPAETFNPVTAEHVWNAIEKLRTPGFKHRFGPSVDFDLITDSGDRFPPKAVFGVAASEALGFAVQPKHFSGGIGTPCFRILESAGYTIISKDAVLPSAGLLTTLEDREWAEGKPKLVSHLRRERAAGLAQAKKDNFIRVHGRLYCEHCKMDPIEKYGEDCGAACIEVHHRSVHVEQMSEGHRTRLEDLECLCASCHRVEHRRIKLSMSATVKSD